NSLQIQGKQVVSTEETPPIYARKMNGGKDAKDKDKAAAATSQSAAQAKEVFGLQPDKLTAFPSPFTDDVTLRMLLKESVNKLDVVVFDMNGRAIFSRGFGSVAKGVWQQKLGLSGRGLANGVYYIKVLGIPGENSIKVVKE
ncbi:T9SS type A sorting domain-containing protein, partial [Foetidibacter luteolus]|uniref:T9SS type A sorting domain-containing protein n=1 Tax=Foetidibacter luteolus TaxID=2608880 RepID=UPI00129BC6C8